MSWVGKPDGTGPKCICCLVTPAEMAWPCDACQGKKHPTCLSCLGKVAWLAGIASAYGGRFKTCPQKYAIAYELLPEKERVP